MSKNWQLKDVVDLEYFLHIDLKSGDDENTIRARDRNIFLDHFNRDSASQIVPDRKTLLKVWLDARREATLSKSDMTLPSCLYGEVNKIFQVVLATIAFLSGWTICWSFLSYSGDEPLNVFIYFAVFIFAQFILLVTFSALTFYKLKKQSLPFSSSILYSLLSHLFLKTALFMKKKWSNHLSADQRYKIEAAFGIIKNKEQIYGSLFFWPIFIWLQIFAVSFNIGLFSAILFKVITSDIAFGWQSTIQFSSEAVHDFIQIIALPWSWLVSTDFASPTLSQVEGSRIILKEGIYHLATPDLVSWWPFLCFSLLTYALFPRIVLLISGIIFQRRSLAHLDFHQGVFEQVLIRMKTPLVTTKGLNMKEKVAPVSGTVTGKAEKNSRKEITTKLTILIPDDIFDLCSREEIEQLFGTEPAYSIENLFRIEKDPESDQSVLAQLEKKRDSSFSGEILIIQEAWRPPLIEHMTFLKELRYAVGNKINIQVGLIGKPRQDTIFTAATDENEALWSAKINSLGDPFIRQVRLAKDA